MGKSKGPHSANLTVRLTVPSDVEPLSKIAFTAARSIHKQHGVPFFLPTPEDTKALIQLLMDDPSMYGIVAGLDGRIVGCAFLHEKDEIKSISGIVIEPKFQGRGVGKKMVELLIERANCRSIRMAFAETFNLPYFNVLAGFGFRPHETISIVSGIPKGTFDGLLEVRPMVLSDVDACDELHYETQGFSRRNEMIKCLDPIYAARPYVALQSGELVAYTCSFSYHGHTIAKDLTALKQLYIAVAGIMSHAGATPRIAIFGRLYPMLLAWALREAGLKLERNTNLMVLGQYKPPQTHMYIPSSDY